MNETNPTPGDPRTHLNFSHAPQFTVALTAILAWAALSLGFLGLKMLMSERPEFVGPPMRANQVELVQESPLIVVRKVSDDVSVVRSTQADSSDVAFVMTGRRDYRGLRTMLDMSGEIRAAFTLTNGLDEAVFVLFKCPHPRAQNETSQNLLAGDLKLQAVPGGLQENTQDAWLWSGTVESHAMATIEITYHVAALKSVMYRVNDADGSQVKHLRVAIERRGLPAMRFESGDGTRFSDQGVVAWERNDFLAPDFFAAHISESRSLFDSLAQLLEIGPIVCLLFLLTVSAVMLARQPLTAVQMLTIAAGYAVYFPLILYLSARFSFVWAVIIAFLVPGILLVNYARWLVAGKAGWLVALVLLALYQLFPTLAAFAGWNRGLVLLCLGVLTLAVLINLQNRALRGTTARTIALLALLISSPNVRSGEVQVVLPAEYTGKLFPASPEPTKPVMMLDPGQYQVRQEAGYFRVEARLPVQVLRLGETCIPLFNSAVYLEECQLQPAGADCIRFVTVSNQLMLFTAKTGSGNIHLSYRVPIDHHDAKQHAEIPLACGPSARIFLASPRDGLEILTGSIWSKSTAAKTNLYEIGVAGAAPLAVEWSDQPKASRPTDSGPAASAPHFYGIGVTQAHHLTVIGSDGSCTDFSEFELPAFQNEAFRLKLPPDARLISISVDGNEIASPAVADRICSIHLPPREERQASYRVLARIAYPAVRLGFIGTLDLTLPEVFQTTGSLDWVVALPNSLETQVISSSLDRQSATPDLSRFGDYGRIVQSHRHTCLAKDLVPPGNIALALKYRQNIPGLQEAKGE